MIKRVSPTFVIRGMYGMGDCIHQRAIIRDMLNAGKKVVLETFYWSMYEDLLQKDLELRLIGGVMPRIRDRKQAKLLKSGLRVQNPIHKRLSYTGETVLKHGSILAAQYASVGMKMPDKPDFSIPVPYMWKGEAYTRIPVQPKPIMVYRPSVLNNLWLSEARSPDHRAYSMLYEYVRDTFFTVSVANLGDKGERIDGREMDADVKFHRGELDFEELAGLFAIAHVSFTCPGFAPVLSQAVGTPTIIVYGGNESFRTTNSVGAHLAPTLALEPINPCACHLKNHDCDKRMDVEAAILRLDAFVKHQIAKQLEMFA